MIELSALLRRAALHTFDNRPETFRNANGVARKTYDIAATALLGFSGVESPFFDLGGLSYCEFLRLPPTVLWSLARSTYLARDEQGEVNVNEMAQHFENLLHLACESFYFAPVVSM